MEAARSWIRPTMLFVIALVATPLLYTGLFRVTPFYASFWPLLIGLGVAMVIAIRNPKWRPAAIGVALASIAHAAFLAYLFMAIGSIE